MTTTVVNIRGRVAKTLALPNHVYVGRAVPRHWLNGSRWANPYKVGAGMTAEEAVRRFREYMESLFHDRPETLEQARRELKGKVLCCWCVNKDGSGECHAKVLAELVDAQGEAVTE